MKVDLDQLEFVDRLLRTILTETEAELEVEFTVTSIYRIGDGGVHGTLPVRGIDWRCHDLNMGKLVEQHINSRWQYDPKRPQKTCCQFHKVSGGGWHLHIQVHPNTIGR